MKKLFFLLSLIALGNATLYRDLAPDVENPKTVESIMENLKTKPLKEQFKVYHFLYKKHYDLNSEEGINRYKVFKENVKYINEMNSKSNSFTLGIGPYTDMTVEEFGDQFACKYENQNNSEGVFDRYADEDDDSKTIKDFPAYDWESWFMYPKKQGCCGSCWAFAAAGVVEGFWNNKRGKKNWLSPQQLVSCDTSNFGCSGGFFDKALEYVQQNGLFNIDDYPYNNMNAAKVFPCRYDELFQKNKARVSITGTVGCGTNRAEKCTIKNMHELIKQGPVAVHVCSRNDKWIHYKDGIINFDEKECKTFDHAVILVGWGVDKATNKEFFRVRSSCGLGWGNGGYAKIEYVPGSTNLSGFILERGVQPLM
jgi:hypothetical protein